MIELLTIGDSQETFPSLVNVSANRTVRVIVRLSLATRALLPLTPSV